MTRQRKYAKISVKKREQLIHMVLNQKKTKVQAAKKLKIKLETAKIIVKRFEQTGTIYEKKMADYSRKTNKSVERTSNGPEKDETLIQNLVIPPTIVQSSNQQQSIRHSQTAPTYFFCHPFAHPYLLSCYKNPYFII